MKNASANLIKHHCAARYCTETYKSELDSWWQEQNDVIGVQKPTSLQEAEMLFRKSNWNISNYKIDKIYLVGAEINESTQIQIALSDCFVRFGDEFLVQWWCKSNSGYNTL